jgi:hypothetical protein
MTKEQSDVVPSHGYTVDNSQEFIPQRSEAPTQPQESSQAKSDASEAKPPAAGSTATEAEGKAPAQETKAPGKNDEMLASMSAQLQQLTQQLNSAPVGSEQQQPTQDPLVQLDSALADLQRKAENGEITYEEMIVQTAPIIEQRATINIQRQMETQAQQRQVQDAQGQFLQEYPDFPEFAQSPAAQAMIQSNPVFDTVSSYFAAREQKAVQESQMLQSKVAELEKQIQGSIKNATVQQGGVVGGETGESVGVPTTFRGDGMDRQKGGIAALRRARSAMN